MSDRCCLMANITEALLHVKFGQIYGTYTENIESLTEVALPKLARLAVQLLLISADSAYSPAHRESVGLF